MICEAIEMAINGRDLPLETAREAMDEIMSGQATSAQIASYLTALRMKGETIDEITASAMVMRDKSKKLRHGGDLMEIVGTGGDKAFTFNISSVASLVIAAAGIPVAKHGNRSMSSKCGSADILEALGVNIQLTPEQSTRVLDEVGICFMFAQLYHSSMKYAAPVRREMGTRTLFNVLGPLTSPASANLNLIGVYDKRLVQPIAQVLANLGVKRAIVVCGGDGLDEITLTRETIACEVENGTLRPFTIDPKEFGMDYCKPSDLTGGEPEENAKIALNILTGADKGAKRNIVLLNAGVCIHIAKDVSLAEGIRIAAETIDSGAAYQTLQKYIQISNEMARGISA